MKILITGGAGFVGRHFTKFFLDKGYEVKIIDNIFHKTGSIDVDKKWPLFDPRDYKNFKFEKIDCRDWFKQNSNDYFDYVLHLAAIVGGREMIENNPIAVADDLSIDAQFWNWAIKSKPKKIVQFSSSASYPVSLQKKGNFRLLKEDDISFKKNIGTPDMTYGWSKLTCEFLGKIAFEKYGLKSVVYRPFSGYGEDQDINYPFPNLCKNIFELKKGKNIKIWGSGKQKRDFIHISDCVRGVIDTMDNIDNGDAINLSTGIYTDFISFVEMGLNLTNKNANIEVSFDKPEGVFARGGDTTKQKAFGFSYRINLKDGLRKMFEYIEKRKI